MKFLRSSSPFIILSSLFFFLSSPLSAKSCSQAADYPGPYSVQFKATNAARDCSYPEDASPLDMDVIKNGRLTSQLVNLEAVVHGDASKLRPNGDGTLNISLSDLSTFGIGGDILQQQDIRNKTLAYRKVIEAYKNYDITHIYREAYADGIYNYDDFKTWACERDLCICGPTGCHLNPSIYSTASQLTPLKDQLQQILDIGHQIIACHDNDAASVTLQCSTEYPLPGGSSYDIAQNVVSQLDPDHLIESWSNSSDKFKFQAYSLHLTQSSPTFVLLVPRKKTCSDIPCILQQFFAPDKPGFIKAIIPETNNLLTGVTADNNRFTPLKDQTSSDSANLPPAGGKLLTELLTKATGVDPDCSNSAPQLSENLGASSIPVKNTNSPLVLPKNFFSSDTLAEVTEDKQYCVYTFSPKVLVDADFAMGKDKSAILPKLMPLKSRTSQIPDLTVNIDAPQSFDTSGQGQTEAETECLRYETDPVTKEQICVEEQSNYVSYEGSGTNSNQPAGKAPLIKKYLTFGLIQPLKSPYNIQDQSLCLVPWLAAGAKASGFDFDAALNTSAYSQTTCPNPLASTIAKSCIDPDKLKSKSDCNLTCSNVEGHPLPQDLITVINKAAAAYNIPPGLILGLFYAEGGFEPRCAGDDRTWSDSEIAPLMQCNPDQCCNNNTGPFGLNPAYFNAAIKQAKQKLGILFDEDNPGNMCNLMDGALVVANTINTQRGYDNQTWYDIVMSIWDQIPEIFRVDKDGKPITEPKDSCHGLPYTGQSTNSCSGWSDSQAMTAIRLQQGLCGEGNPLMDAHAQQALDIFHLCSN